MKVSGKTKVCTLIGDPVEHSLSPLIHNAAFEYLGLDYIYVAFTVKKEGLRDAISGVRGLGIYGVNVTMPHKTEVIQYLDVLDETAKNVGSVNTILNRDGKLIGYTTDGAGTVNALRYYGVDPSGKKVVILGAGGSSRSISFTLAGMTKELVILNRTLEKAERLRKDLSQTSGITSRIVAAELNSEALKRELSDADILINATSVGMKNADETPVPSSLLKPHLVVFDLVYDPIETRLLREARIVGAKTVDGLAMLIHQGAASFEIWSGMEAPVDLMFRVAMERLREAGKTVSGA
jgi:shikimate dehydrogenase